MSTNPTPIPVTAQDVADAANAAGIDKPGLTTAFGLLKALVDAGFTDPTLFVNFMSRYKLRDDKAKLQTQANAATTDQQQKVQAVYDATNPPIGVINNQIAAIDAQLKLLEG